ncbi:MAG: hypothetical protein ACRD4L_05680 [Pyrinomonadaceae bacterium]
MQNEYTKFDTRLVEELEERNEFFSCAGCVIGGLEIGAGVAISFLGAQGAGGALVNDGTDRVDNC